jgi:hypothetical protein
MLIKMTNFDFEEIFDIWEVVKGRLLILNHRGKSPKYKALDRLFLILIFVKHKPKMEIFAQEYDLDNSIVNRMFDTIVSECCEPLVKAFIPTYTMAELQELEIISSCYQSTKLIVDVHFQPSN